MSDTNSFIYRYSWDQDDLQNYPWPEHYVKQPEVLAYLKHVVEKYGKHWMRTTVYCHLKLYLLRSHAYPMGGTPC